MGPLASSETSTASDEQVAPPSRVDPPAAPPIAALPTDTTDVGRALLEADDEGGWIRIAFGFGLFIAFGLVAFLFFQPRDEAWRLCTETKPTHPDATIRHCGDVIAAAKQPVANLAKAHRLRAKAFLAIGEFASAEQDYSEALKTVTNDPALYAERGDVRFRNGLTKAAIEDFDAAIALDPAKAEPFIGRGNAELADAQPDKALESFTRALTLRPNAVEAVYRRALANVRLGMIADADADYSRALDLAPQNPNYWNARCWFRATQNIDLDLAVSDCDRALALKPDFAPAMDSRAFALLRLGRLDDALMAYNQAITAGTEYAWPFFGRGIVKKRLGDIAGAELDFALARERQPDIDAQYAAYGEAP